MLTPVRSPARRYAGLVVALTAAVLAVHAIAVTTPGLAQQEVSIADPNLEAAIREALGKPEGPITDTDLAGLASVEACSCGVSSLAGIEYCVGASVLVFAGNQISDLSPLSGLKSLVGLDLQDNAISDLSPLSSLAGVFGLSWLNVAHNQITDLSPLSAFTRLWKVQLGNNEISDLSPLSGITELWWVEVESNQISDLSPLSDLTGLMQLNAADNQITDLLPLRGLAYLQQLELADNQISDLSPLSALPYLKRLGLAGNQISDLSPLVDNAGLGEGDRIDLEGNPLNSEAYDVHIPALQARGAYVVLDPNTAVTAPQEASTLPSAYVLYPNEPNPFNPVTSIAYDLPEAVHVSLSVYNALGQPIAVLASGQQQRGHYTVRWDAGKWSSGVYFFRLDAVSCSKTRPMLLLR